MVDAVVRARVVAKLRSRRGKRRGGIVVWCLCENVLVPLEESVRETRSVRVGGEVSGWRCKLTPADPPPRRPSRYILPAIPPSLVASPAPRSSSRPACFPLPNRLVCISALRVTRVTVPPASAASYAAPAGRNTLVRASRPTESLRAKRHCARARPVGEDDRTPRGEGGGERSCQKARGVGGREGGGAFVGG